MSTMESFPAVTPSVDAVKVIVTVQLAPAGRLEPQLFVWVKVEGLTVMLLMANDVLLVFVTVTVSELVEVPTGAPGSVTLLVERVTYGVVPVRVTV